MPTGTCNFPQHHGPSAGQPISLVILIALGAIIIAHWRTVLVCLVVSVILTVFVALMVMLIHRRHESAAEHRAWFVERQAELQRRAARQQIAQPRSRPAQEIHHHHHVHQLPAPQPQQIHQHIHLHGLTAEDVAGVIDRQAQVNPAIATGVPYTPGTEAPFQ
jgi:uncharacterized membrane protein YraQ (UPF0718 family)